MLLRKGYTSSRLLFVITIKLVPCSLNGYGEYIGDAVRAKARLKAGGHVADLVASGEAELAVHQISEILPVKGVRLVGPLPAPIQNTTVYAAGLGASAQEAGAAKALLDYLAGPATAAVLNAKGMEKP